MNEIKSLDNKIIVKPHSPNLGAVVTGINLSHPLSSNDLICIKNMFNKFQVLFFQEQSEISPPRIFNFSDIYYPSLNLIKEFLLIIFK